MSTKLQQAARAALEALENLHGIDTDCVTIWVEDEIEALRQALSAQGDAESQYQRGYRDGYNRRCDEVAGCLL